MKVMLDGRAVRKSDVLVDMPQRAFLPAMQMAHIRIGQIARNESIDLPDQRQSHMVIGCSQRRSFDQESYPAKRAARDRPCVTTMRVAIRRPDLAVVPPLPTERQVMFDVLALWPELVAVTPRLNNIVLLERVNRVGGPGLAPEFDIGVDPSQVLTIFRLAGETDIEQTFFVPDQSFRAHPDMIDVRIGIAFERTIPICAFDHRQLDARVQHVFFELFVKSEATFPPDRIGDRSYYMEQFRFHNIRTSISAMAGL